MSKSKITYYSMSNSPIQIERIEQALIDLGLNGILASYKKIIEENQKNKETLYDLIESLIRKQLDFKQNYRIQSWIKQAKFPCLKTIEEFNFNWPDKIDKPQIKDLASCRFIEYKENVVFFGPQGIGKTHLAIALGLKAIEKGKDVKFLRLKNLVDLVEKNSEDLRYHRLFNAYVKPKLIIIDEMDSHSLSSKASEFLYDLLYERYEYGATIFTSHDAFSSWEKLFESKTKANAIIDRIMHYGITITIEGKSYRLKDKLELLKKKRLN